MFRAAMISHRAWAEIDLGALRRNVAAIRAQAGPATDVMLVVKADAYGHGLALIASAAERCGVHSFGVRDSSEALTLREAGVVRPILVLGTVVEAEMTACIEHGIELAIHTSDRVRSLGRMIRKLGRRVARTPRVHLNVDTGMGRLGLPVESAPKVLDALLDTPEVELAGIMTHLARTEGSTHPFTDEQVARFRRFLAHARARGLDLGRGGVRVHFANSAGLFSPMSDRGDLVRPGIAAYGVLPKELPDADRVEPVMSLRAQIVFMKDVARGTSISYGQEWTAPCKTRIATVPIGYYDGVPWRLKNAGVVLVRGERAPIVGRVTMDYVMVDIGGIRGVRVGDTVTLFGRDGASFLPVEEVAKAVGTIPYEITCAVGPRVRRVPIEERELVESTPARGGAAL